jgi:hypothetical protein
MRKSIAFFGGALFVVMSLSIYLVVDQLSRMPSYESVIEAQVMSTCLSLGEGCVSRNTRCQRLKMFRND